MSRSRGFKLDIVPLTHASLCLDCEMITATHASCLACGSVALINISRALNSSMSKAGFKSAPEVRADGSKEKPGFRAPFLRPMDQLQTEYLAHAQRDGEKPEVPN